MNLSEFDVRFLQELPDAPGVYFFIDEQGGILYIGRATSLRSRVRSYFSQDMLLVRGPKIEKMIGLATDIRWEQTDSVLEAILAEANLIRNHQPPYNTDVKDDKSWNWVVVTKERFPRVLLERGKKLASAGGDMKHEEKRLLGYTVRYRFGPFPSGGDLKTVLGILRRIFPFRDTCVPFDPKSEKKSNGKACFNAGIGLCPGVCSGAVSARVYAVTIRRIKMFFEGKKEMLRRQLERDMNCFSKELRFEEAYEAKRALFAIDHISDTALLTQRILERDSAEEVLNERIEAYDVAHTGGTETVGVMVVVGRGIPERSQYRKFIIRGEANGNDLMALEELLRRRFHHSEWPMPLVLVVDGSDIQRQVAEAVLQDVLKEKSCDIPVVSVLKDEHHKPKDILGDSNVVRSKQRDILLANSEAHRFAITFHRKRRGKKFLSR